MVFRCDTDGSHVECLGQNFRNPYEVAVDSYGALWQSDNDDDGNRGVRINYVMQNGNYGYKDEMTGAWWGENRTNIEDSIPYRHWHLNDPGVVPNMLQTGAGSPTGILVYEGSLLPAQFQNQLIHSDAGPNVVRTYTIKKSGAGYRADIINIVKGDKDQWFRPSDVCVAPDGSLFIADWYDVGVGGHQAGDQVRGRIYRVAPKGSAYTIKKESYNDVAGAITALQNYSWPGNVRELRNVVERLMLLAVGERVDKATVELALPEGQAKPTVTSISGNHGGSLSERVAQFERDTIIAELKRQNNHITNTAKALGLERSHLYKKCQQLGLDLRQLRAGEHA